MESNVQSKGLSAAAMPLVHPLDYFYAEKSDPLPRIEAVAAEELPEPFGKLLAHNNDMTTTLERFYGGTTRLEVLGRSERDGVYFREVALISDQAERPVEFGAIKINLNLFSPSARRFILEEKLPLGRIIHDHSVLHSSRPKAYFRVYADDFINAALRLENHPAQVLYGRRNTLLDGAQRPLAEIVEILPPVEGAPAAQRN